jgi:hypothetical protein
MNNQLADIFCAECQKVTPHEGTMDSNGEFVFHCTEVSVEDPKDDTKTVYHHFIKFPANTDPAKFNAMVEKHEEDNIGQLSVAKQQEKLGELISGLTLRNADAKAEAEGEAQPTE